MIEIVYTVLITATAPITLSPRTKVGELAEPFRGQLTRHLSQSLYLSHASILIICHMDSINYKKEKTFFFSQSVWHHYTVLFADTFPIAYTAPIAYTVLIAIDGRVLQHKYYNRFTNATFCGIFRGYEHRGNKYSN